MYYQLIDWDQPSVTERDLPRAEDPAFWNRLFEAGTPPVSSHDLTIRLGKACLARDYLPLLGISRAKLCSQRFLELLERHAVPSTTYPVRLCDRKTGRPFSEPYAFWLAHSLNNAIDWERSQDWVDVETGLRRFTTIVLTSEIEAAAPLLFHAQATGRTFVHETLRQHMEAAGLTGLAFAPLDMASAPSAGVNKQLLEQRLREHPDDWAAWVRLSEVLRKARHYEQALAPLEQALRLKPDAEKVWYKRGRLLHQLGKLAEAQTALKQAMALDAQSLAWGEYCTIQRTLGHTQEALACAQAWVRSWGQSPLPWYEVAAAQAAVALYEEALLSLEQGLQRGGGARLGDMLLLKGDTLFALGKYEEAVATYTSLVHASPLERAVWARKAAALRAVGREEEAEQAEQEVQRLEQRREGSLKRRPM